MVNGNVKNVSLLITQEKATVLVMVYKDVSMHKKFRIIKLLFYPLMVNIKIFYFFYQLILNKYLHINLNLFNLSKKIY